MHHGLVLQLDRAWMKSKREKRVKIYLVVVKELIIAVKKNEKTDCVFQGILLYRITIRRDWSR